MSSSRDRDLLVSACCIKVFLNWNKSQSNDSRAIHSLHFPETINVVLGNERLEWKRTRPENISGIYNFFYRVFRKPDNKNGCGLFPLRVKFYHAMLLSLNLILDAIKLIVIHWTHGLSSRWLRAYNEIWKSVQPTDYSYHSADNLTIWRFRAQKHECTICFSKGNVKLCSMRRCICRYICKKYI